jgi:hypothetical protein
LPKRSDDPAPRLIYPTLLGAGKRLFPDAMKSLLALAECQQLGGGIVLTRYMATSSK